MLDSFYLDVDFDEDIFDRVNSMYTKEYEAYVEKVDQLLSTSSTLNKVGGASTYARLLSWKDTYNISREKSATEAAKIREAVRQRTFDLAHSVDDCRMFWDFLKTLHHFQNSPWYCREYMVEKLLGRHTVDVESIL